MGVCADGSHKVSTGFHTPIEQEPDSPDSYANPLQGFNPIGPLPTTFIDDRYCTMCTGFVPGKNVDFSQFRFDAVDSIP